MNSPNLWRDSSLAAITLACALACGSAAADDAARPAENARPFKLTLGEYAFSDGSRGTDINLRHTSDFGNMWLGDFRLPDQDIDQWRTGWDQTYGESWRFLPSLQWASQGFVGGSVQVETGDPWYAGAALGRTNLRPYWNLNFDPNDAYSLYGGRHGAAGETLSVLWVRDNRINPDQRHLHFTYRRPLADGERVTLDVLHKQGLVDGEMIRRWGLTATYDWPRFFVRLAYDPKTNFTSVDARRVSIGTRF